MAAAEGPRTPRVSPPKFIDSGTRKTQDPGKSLARKEQFTRPFYSLGLYCLLPECGHA